MLLFLLRNLMREKVISTDHGDYRLPEPAPEQL